MSAASQWGDDHADIYDDFLGALPDVDQIVERMGGAGNRVLELGSGTGRVALPLAASGAHVVGVESSERMIDVMRSKQPGSRVVVHAADFTTLALGEVFDHVLLTRNTLYMVPDQPAQVETMRRAADHLAESGVLWVDLGIPRPDQNGLSFGHEFSEGVVTYNRLHEPVSQELVFSRIIIGHDRVRVLTSKQRYIWPAELDLMARLAGLELVGSYADYLGAAFTPAAPARVAVYQRGKAAA